MAFVTLDELRQFLRIPIPAEEPDPLTDEEVVLNLAREAASTAIARAANRTFETASTASARVFTAYNDGTRIRIPIHDTFDAAVDIDIAYDPDGEASFTEAVTGTFSMGPANAADLGLPYTEIVFDRGVYVPCYDGGVQVTASWGWDALPDTIKNATLVQAARYVKRRDAPFGVAGSPDMGNELRLLAKLDPDVEVMVADFRKWYV